MIRDIRSPIFLLGVERSGTNLLRVILDNNSNIYAPSPLHFLSRFYDSEIFYGSLLYDKNFKKLVTDALELVYQNLGTWSGFNIKIEDVLNDISAENRSLMTVFKYIYDVQTRNAGKRRWFCKDRELYNYVYDLKNLFPDCRFIHLVRDPRDTCLSFMLRQKPKSIYSASIKYLGEQEKCIQLYTQPCIKDLILTVKYENLLEDSYNEVKRICDFINEPFEDKMLNFFNNPRTKNISKKSQVWQNLSKPIMTKNYNKYKTQLTTKQIKLIESMNHRIMRYFGYELEYPNQNLRFEGLFFYSYKFTNEFVANFKSQVNRYNYEERTKRKKMQNVIKKIRNRHYLDDNKEDKY